MPISEQELNALFDWTIDDETEVQYRRYTTDSLPSYIVTLSNNSDTVPIRVYASSSSYINVTSTVSKRVLNSSSYITLDPLTTADVLLVFSPTGMNASTESTPFLSFPIRAMEVASSSDTEGDSSTDDSSDNEADDTSTSGNNNPPDDNSSGNQPDRIAGGETQGPAEE